MQPKHGLANVNKTQAYSAWKDRYTDGRIHTEGPKIIWGPNKIIYKDLQNITIGGPIPCGCFYFRKYINYLIWEDESWLTQWFNARNTEATVFQKLFLIANFFQSIQLHTKYFPHRNWLVNNEVIITTHLYYKMKLSVCMYFCISVCLYPNIWRNTARTALKQTPKIR